MEEKILIAMATSVTKVAIGVFLEDGRKLFGTLGQDVKEKLPQLFFTASKKYVKNYNDRHCTLKVLGMAKPVNLEDIYTTLQFLDNQGIGQFVSLDDMQNSFRQNSRRGFRIDEEKNSKQPGIKVASNEQFLMVLGAPGSGKSTFLRKIGLEALKGKKKLFKHNCIPVFIELKRLPKTKIDLTAIITEEFAICGFPYPEDFTQEALEKGKLLILLDGLDEVPTKNLVNVLWGRQVAPKSIRKGHPMK